MIPTIQQLAEPIPGYRLIERLGRGGFGEVWKAEAPGGLHKAIKFIFGDLEGGENDRATAEQELKALNRVKGVRHPFILSLERVDVVNGQLLIVMELADRNLWERFKECRNQGLPGIPRDELLGYMEEAAEALDLMNNEYQLQHLDIKPQNLFLVRNHVKVADFGLVKDFEGKRGSVTGGVTPVYAAPETFEGWISRFCDQYSLAIVYQELVTGQRPFDGANARQLLMQHLQAPPNLTPLIPSDRLAVGRSLAKKPDERFDSCADFVRALRYGATAGGDAPPPAQLATGTVAEHVSQSDTNTPEDRGQAADLSVGDVTQTPDTLQSHQPLDDMPAVALPSVLYDPLPSSPEPETGFGTDVLHRSGRPMATPRSVGAPSQTDFVLTPSAAGDGVLFPAYLLGLGHTGIQVINRFREALHERFGSLDGLDHFRYLAIDTDPETLHSAVHAPGQAPLTGKDVQIAKLNRPSHYLKPREGMVPFQSWFDPQVLYRMPRLPSTMGMRSLGRLALCDHYRTIAPRLRSDLEALFDPQALQRAAATTHLGVRMAPPRIYVVCSVAGATGSGMFLDVAYMLQHQLARLKVKAAVVGVLLVPDVEHAGGPQALANTYAALTELHHFSAPDSTYSFRFDTREPPLSFGGPPFDQTILVPYAVPGPVASDAPAPREGPAKTDTYSPDNAVGLAAGLLFRELATPVGSLLDAARGDLHARTRPAGPTCRTIGQLRLCWPQKSVVTRVADRISQQIVERWIVKDAKAIRKEVHALVDERWSQEDLAAASIREELESLCETTLQEAPESAFENLTARVAVRGPAGVTLDPTAAQTALDKLEELLGQTEEARLAPGTIPAVIDAGIKPLVIKLEHQLAELAVSLVEKPGFRLAGAEEAIKRFIGHLDKAVADQLEARQKAAEFADNLLVRLKQHLVLLQAPATGKKKILPNPAETLELLRTYPLARYQALILERVWTVYRSILGHLPEYLREVGLCRANLVEFAKGWADAPANTRLEVNLGPVREVFPDGRASFDEAVNDFLNELRDDDYLELDGRVQDAIKTAFKALVSACMTGPKIFNVLRMVLTQQVVAFIEWRLGEVTPADLFFEGPGEKPDLEKDIAGLFQQATPLLTASRPTAELTLLTASANPAGKKFRALVVRAVSDATMQIASSSGDIVIYREHPFVRIAELKQTGPSAEQAFRLMCTKQAFTSHSRTDAGWLPVRAS